MSASNSDDSRREPPTSAPIRAISDTVKGSWHQFLDVFEPLRPELYRYCRYLTRNAWDAEDLVQDTLARGFVTLGTVFKDLPSPRAWLFRVASNLWIDRQRRSQHAPRLARDGAALDSAERESTALGGVASSTETRLPREAAGTLLVQLSPQERAAVVLKDVFELSLEEIAEALTTSVGAVKAALHRGRGKLAEPEPDVTRAPAPGVLDAFCAAFNAADLPRLTALLLDTAVVEIVGVVTEYGPEAAQDADTGSFAGMLSPIVNDARGGVAEALLADYLGDRARCEVRVYRDAPIVVFWYGHRGGDAVRAVASLETDGERLTRVRNYFFTPDVIAEVCAELALPYRINGYRYW